jgi:uncharacterized repeat protein (TIGR01451 family)
MKDERRQRWVAGGAPPSRSMRALWLRASITVTLALLLLGPGGGAAAGRAAAPDGVITVCPGGPPGCDYAAIQPALDAAGPGDTVRVAPGAYAGQLALRSGVTLESTGGPEVTVITAAQGPVVAASGVTAVVLHGLTISGEYLAAQPVGLDLVDSEVSLSDCVITGVRGKDGGAAAPDGETAIAIRSAGASVLALDGATIEEIRGGDGLPDAGAAGGDAIGVAAAGSGQIVMTETAIWDLTGGDAGSLALWPYDCQGRGGRATAVQTDGDVHLDLDGSRITGLQGGAPCAALAANCVGYAGPVVAVRATGGSIAVRGTLFSGFVIKAAHGSEANYVIHTSATAGTVLEGNTIALSAPGGASAQTLQPAGTDSPFCIPPPATVIAVASIGDARLVVTHNAFTGVAGTGWGGGAAGVLVKGTADAELSRNTVLGVTGGYDALATGGFRLQGVQSALIDANVLGEIHGGDAPGQFYYAYFGDPGGSAAGIELADVTAATVVNNMIREVSGGRGSDMGIPVAGQDGGDATALLVTGSAAAIRNNTCFRTVPGPGGDGSPPGQPGSAVGLRLAGARDVIVANNILGAQGTGISSDAALASPLQYNDLWSNGTNYKGLSPGAKDLHVNPAFVDPANGDLHLQPNSPLIDAGTNAGIPPRDIDGNPRPLDGNGDGVAVADIGADEYWPGLHAVKAVDRPTATAGDVLTYELSLDNPTTPLVLPGVRVTDTIPAHLTYVKGSLSASSGAWDEKDGVITWNGAVSRAAPVAITFQATVDQIAGPLAIVNRAVLNDGGITRTLQALTVIDPLFCYLPVVLRSR